MNISSLIYLSQAEVPFEVGELEELEELAQRENTLYGITGFLNYSDEHFFQYIEGSREALYQLMHNIKNDQRHLILKQIDMPAENERLFPDWGMRVFQDGRYFSISIEANIQRLIENFSSDRFKEEHLITLLRRELAELQD